MTIKEIAQLSGVSISTVSKIMNHKDEHISPETRDKVLSIAKEYNYSPYAFARNTSISKSFLLGVLLRSEPNYGKLLVLEPYPSVTWLCQRGKRRKRMGIRRSGSQGCYLCLSGWKEGAGTRIFLGKTGRDHRCYRSGGMWKINAWKAVFMRIFV